MIKITVIGSINVDFLTSTNILPEEGETIRGYDFNVFLGGKGANQAVAASRLGGKVTLIGAIGNDIYGDFALEQLEKESLNIEHIKRVDSPTGTANIILYNKDNRIIIIPGANEHVTIDFVMTLHEVILESDIVLVQLGIPMETVRYILDFTSRNGIKSIFNPAPAVRLDEEMLSNATIITPNRTELRIIEKSFPGENPLRMYPNKILVTKGEDGVDYFNGYENINIPSTQVEVVDTTGAGDTFNGALAVFLGQNPLETAISLASKSAAISVTKKGAQEGMPYLRDVIKDITLN